MVNTTRFGTIEVAPEEILHFPKGLIGLAGTEYVLVPAGSGPFTWLQSLSDPALALPLTRPERFFPGFGLELAEEDAERLTGERFGDTDVYVTVRAAATSQECTANLKAPIVVMGDPITGARHAHQVINQAAGAELRAPLFA